MYCIVLYCKSEDLTFLVTPLVILQFSSVRDRKLIGQNIILTNVIFSHTVYISDNCLVISIFEARFWSFDAIREKN